MQVESSLYAFFNPKSTQNKNIPQMNLLYSTQNSYKHKFIINLKKKKLQKTEVKIKANKQNK